MWGNIYCVLKRFLYTFSRVACNFEVPLNRAMLTILKNNMYIYIYLADVCFFWFGDCEYFIGLNGLWILQTEQFVWVDIAIPVFLKSLHKFSRINPKCWALAQIYVVQLHSYQLLAAYGNHLYIWHGYSSTDTHSAQTQAGAMQALIKG